MSSKCINHFIGTAGWSIPSGLKPLFPTEGSHLERYAQNLNAVEINSSFYKDHKYQTYVKWSESVPKNFKFSVKLSRYYTHETKLSSTDKISELIECISGLGSKWGVLLVQLPPKLNFNAQGAKKFIKILRNNLNDIPIVWEPRHISWNTPKAVDLLSEYVISRVRADPDHCPVSDDLRIKNEFIRYLRLHGSPQIYKSAYEKEFIEKVTKQIAASSIPTWCIFDNTTYGYATENALDTYKSLSI